MNKSLAFFSVAFILLVSLSITSVVFAENHPSQENFRSDVAESHPFQASLTPDIALHDRDVIIEGLTLNIWGENQQRALSLGFINGSSMDSAGFSLGLILNYSDSYKGVHWACVNYTQKNFSGWQGGFVNYTNQYFKGFQSGFLNYARKMTGLQLGLMNFAETVDSGLQIGLLNVISENKWFSDFPYSVAPAMIFVNWRF